MRVADDVVRSRAGPFVVSPSPQTALSFPRPARASCALSVPGAAGILAPSHGVWRSWLARCVWDARSRVQSRHPDSNTPAIPSCEGWSRFGSRGERPGRGSHRPAKAATIWAGCTRMIEDTAQPRLSLQPPVARRDPKRGPGRAALSPGAQRDLNLTEIAEAVAGSHCRAADIQGLLLALNTDPDVIRYRQDILEVCSTRRNLRRASKPSSPGERAGAVRLSVARAIAAA